jgi:hypothetical protein
MTSHEDQVRILHADQRRDAAFVSRLAVAEAELHDLSEQARAAYRRYNELDQQQAAKADEIRELKREIREAVQQNG